MRYAWAALLATLATGAFSKAPDGAPPAKTVPFTETVQGIRVDDPYRWMETGGDDYQAWLKAQAAAANSWLSKLPALTAMLKDIERRSGGIESVGAIERRGTYIFVARRGVGAQTAKLMVREGPGGIERVLFDPASLDTATVKGNAIGYWEASPDGAHVYLGVSAGGSEEATLRIIETKTGRFVDGEVPQALYNGGTSEIGGMFPQWMPDGSGFFYNRLAEGAKRESPDYYLNSRLFLHRIGTPTVTDRLVVARGMAGAPEMQPVEAPVAFVYPGSRTALLVLSDGVGRSLRLLRAPLADVTAGKARWVPVGSRADQIESVTMIGEDLYMVRRDRPRGRVVVLRGGATDVAAAPEVVPERESVIDTVIGTGDGVYVLGRNAMGAQLRLLTGAGKLAPVALPFNGASYIAHGSTAGKGLLLSLENYVTPRTRLLVTGTSVVDTKLGPLPPYPVDAYVAETAIVTAREGTKVPVDFVRRKDLAKDGKRPVLLDAYGAYGINGDPYFNPRIYGFLDAGGIYATAKVRGGGEFGRDWWQAGKGVTKPNTWRDAIDSALWFNTSGWTSGKRITLWGTSAGGIMVGRAVTERPDLWAGAVASVGILNAMRFEFGPNGKTNIAEFGTVTDPVGAKALHEMDAYLHVKDGTAYPPMLVTAGANDPRVIAWQPGKFAARMQAAGTGGPTVFSVDFDQGHGIGSMRTQLDLKAAQIGAFTLWAAEQAAATVPASPRPARP